MTRSRIVVLVLVAAALGDLPEGTLARAIGGAGAGSLVVQQTPVPPAFHASVLLVPVDVRVVDESGNPVRDLKATDFAVYENGLRQQIAHFSSQAYVAGAPPAPLPRTFFFVLGRGRLNARSMALDALIEFLRSRLLPEDRVGVLAYLHLVEPTTDHSAVVRLLERYRAQHEAIEDKLARDAKRGSGAPSWELALDTQLAIDTLFEAPGLPPGQRLPATDESRGFTLQDGSSLLRSLGYLGRLAGEKQLVLLIESGFPNADWYASGAAAARVSVSTIQTRGKQAIWAPGGRYAGSLDSAPSPGVVVNVVTALSRLADHTGGQAFSYLNAATAFDRLARATSYQYLLGYYPTTPPADGEYRELRVTVSRRGLTMLYRHSYEARPRSVGTAPTSEGMP